MSFFEFDAYTIAMLCILVAGGAVAAGAVFRRHQLTLQPAQNLALPTEVGDFLCLKGAPYRSEL